MLGAEVVTLGLQLDVLRKGGGEHLQALGHDFLADTVTGDHCEANAARHTGTLPLVPWIDIAVPAFGQPPSGNHPFTPCMVRC
ncbi:hypothetical protein SSPO_034570 [Streptomyces antimycoticus]|uniref:Uncharacterized protein n=1 Tax=Streptomyces antimycoticus TaxID=68175 RepID=A0A499UVA6_9ACTN|nr:hypothetical protein SSPO_034570 [Streptomyces antimycoticus]